MIREFTVTRLKVAVLASILYRRCKDGVLVCWGWDRRYSGLGFRYYVVWMEFENA